MDNSPCADPIDERHAWREGRGGLMAAAAIIGVGLSGFFDGILLHQILQWHHLLSLMPGETFRSLEVQILADGLFHALMYAVTAAGLWMLWRRRRSLAEAGWRTIAGGGLLGFGLWNVADIGLLHWVLRIHRVRLDVPNPMLYDIVWILLLGAAPAIAGWLLLRQGRSDGYGPAAGALVSVLALLAAPLAALPQGNGRDYVVLLRPGAPLVPTLNAVIAADGRIVAAGATMMVVRFDRPFSSAKLYNAGALLVTRSPIFAGCVAAGAGQSRRADF